MHQSITYPTIKVIPLKTHFVSTVAEYVAETEFDDFYESIRMYIDTHSVYVREYTMTYDNHIQLFLNVDEVDENMENVAIQKLAENNYNHAEGIYEFGPSYTFSLKDCEPIIKSYVN